MQVSFRSLFQQYLKIFIPAYCKTQVGLCPTIVNTFIKVAQRHKKLYPLRWTTFLAISWPFASETQHKSKFAEKLKDADSLYEKGSYSECLDYLSGLRQSNEPENVEVLWRMSRALYNMANDIATKSKKKEEMIFEAYELIDIAMEVDPNHYAVHKWKAILLDLTSSYMGIKKRIMELESVKQYMMRANELNPKDATTLYMLGEWCYQIADMSWHQRILASTLFTTPPNSSFEEALEYFLKAEQAEPRFYSLNLLMLGKTYLELGRTEQAMYYLDLALSYPAKTNDDHRANKQAKALLSSLR